MNPTSNHNCQGTLEIQREVVYLLNPTSNHNQPANASEWVRLYIFWILHQTTTCPYNPTSGCSCISFESYIKPQLYLNYFFFHVVVYLLNPTSNHNLMPVSFRASALYIIWILHQTTTTCVKPLIPTRCISFESYIKPQLRIIWQQECLCCISFESYIKPQPGLPADMIDEVVYLLNPTSNHNPVPRRADFNVLYIFWILHQTTTKPVFSSSL